MELIIESGATKADYCLVRAGIAVCRCQGSGVNLATMDMDTVSLNIRDAVSHLNEDAGCGMGESVAVDTVHFYGAGLTGGNPGLADLLKSMFPGASLELCSDLEAAARAVCGHSAGVAAILGTGSNSCMYDGVRIVRNIRPCGFILGDFGSGAAMGKRLLADCLQGMMPDALAEDIRCRFPVDYSSVVASVYRGDAPARYLASFAPYVLSVCRGENEVSMNDSGIRLYAENLVKDNFRLFFRRCIEPYGPDAGPVGVVGSFGFAFRDILETVAKEEGVFISGYMPSPMDGLVKYHGTGA